MFKTSNFITAILPSQRFLTGKIFKSIISCSTMAVDNDWKGVPMSHIIGSQSPWGAPEFPLVQPGFNHAVLYHIPGSGTTLDRPPKPQIGKDKWDQEHVRMPFSKESLYPVPNGAGKSDLRSRWEMIQDALNKPIRNTEELADTILTYNTQFKDRWGFRSLHKLFELLDEDESQYFFDVTLPEIAKLALALPKLVQSPIPLLKQHKNRSVSLSQQQISSLLANAFFCTFPRRNTHKKDAEYSSYPFINFNALYNCSPSAHVLEKIKCLCHYFRRVCQKVPVGVVTFSRRSVPPRTQPHWPSSDKLLSELPVHVDPQDTIEDAHGLIQVDFANKYLGGGVLGNGSVQEEIRFVICPELLISMLFTEYMRPNEALIMIGCEQFSTYTGYGHSFQWLGDYTDDCPYDSSGRRRCGVLAIDALPFHSQLQEHRKEAVDRELNKKSKKIRPIENIKTSDPTPISFGAMDALDESPHNSLSRNTSKHTEKGEHSKTSNLTSRLFDEMEKLDEDSGKLNLKSPQKSYFGQKSKQESAMDVDDNILSEVSPDVKKKLTRKITYYFSKKPI
ncbi:jg20925 [Pararge aegeria aegeria]|uniref:poly(ADP-ribose) glycohydrolase n=1 Tax=Pararge aegeria aegeria TaxID=348720 RepID=A0A8S4RJE5_9NEOP|nr:jg20925 [Pararge aegeria aegeria]